MSWRPAADRAESANRRSVSAISRSRAARPIVTGQVGVATRSSGSRAHARSTAMTRDRQERLGAHLELAGFVVPSQSRAAERAFDDARATSDTFGAGCE